MDWLYKMGYRLHCTYNTHSGDVLRCFIKFDLLENVYAFQIGDKVITSGLSGKVAANNYFKNNLANIVDLASKKVEQRQHLYYIHYKGHNGKDMVEMRTTKMSLRDLTVKWHEWYKSAIQNHGYRLQYIEQAF